jgi:ribonuclease-3
MTLSEFKINNSLTFTNEKLFEQAFIHRSYINENPKTHLEHNERLEFLGDAVIDLAIADRLTARFPSAA